MVTATLNYRVGDVFGRLAEISDDSIDLIVSSPPFLALRSYLPDDHPDKHREIGTEPTPAAFIDTHLALSAEYARVLAPHGTLCYEIGDTYSGSSQGGGDLVAGSGGIQHKAKLGAIDGHTNTTKRSGSGWPLPKSMCIIPHLFTASLAYGRNLLTGEPSPAGMWRIRNVICWARPNPPVGALGDKFRPATSYITVACKGAKRYFDLDAVRSSNPPNLQPRNGMKAASNPARNDSDNGYGDNPAGAPPLDWHADDHPEDGDWLWKLSTKPYKGAHFATYPLTLPKRLIEAMCPLKVCTVCGVPSTRIVDVAPSPNQGNGYHQGSDGGGPTGGTVRTSRQAETLGWTSCGHDAYRTGIVLDPFAGSGTTLEAAQAVGRSAIGIDIDERNADLARERVGMYLDIDYGANMHPSRLA